MEDQVKPERKGRARWGMLGLAMAVQAGATLVTYGIGPLSAIWQQEFGWPHTQADLLMSAVQLGPLLSMIWVGRMLDRHGERGLAMGIRQTGIPIGGAVAVSCCRCCQGHSVGRRRWGFSHRFPFCAGSCF
ncbi:hypothetical protein GCM10007416_05770 [Kroppenstedtia guangzhouensis]|uniref:Major Facilitator Superfamily protein n=1 Tax=Kroppenstedtia guangzhouensis TaxID=1274356 RepID=A0ABQ1G1T4_9BACL|nr:hypothetical protein [Kroppenstedtia guangzhouensis]GGA35768.1 hypothetical protein GCM10007416_05770 [Kroppenstedtia guangzhouensis]